MKPEFYYSHRGRHREHYGKNNRSTSFGIAFAVEIKKDMIDSAPAMTAMVESSRTYLKAATIGLSISYFIRSLDTRLEIIWTEIISQFSLWWRKLQDLAFSEDTAFSSLTGSAQE
jgi:hypothetical protein